MKQKWANTIYLLVLTSFIGACLDVVELDIPKEEDAGPYIVEGSITQGTGPHFVQISRATPLGIRHNLPAQIVEIWIENKQGQTESLQDIGEGKFALQSQVVVGTIGDAYQLHFRTANNRTYISTWETLLPVSTIDSLYFERSFEDRFTDQGVLIGKSFIDFFADVQLTTLPQSPFMRWETERWWQINEFIRPSPPSKACYIKDPLLNSNRIQLFDGRGVNTRRWQKQLIGTAEADFRFFEKTYINLHQYSLTKAAYTYWQKLDQVISQSGDIFDTPPAAVPGNVHNIADPNELVLGYFGASVVDTFHLPVFRQDLDVRVDWLCNSPRNTVYSVHPCIDCTIIPNSTIERPDYW